MLCFFKLIIESKIVNVSTHVFNTITRRYVTNSKERNVLQNAEKIMHSFIPTEPRSRHGISVPAVCHREKRVVVVGGKLYINVLTRHCVLIKIMIAFFYIFTVKR